MIAICKNAIVGACALWLAQTAVLQAEPVGPVAPAVKDVLITYSDIAHAGFEDSFNTAKTMGAAIDTFLKAPNAETLKAARAAWVAARVPYQQTEVFRFGNPIVDDWEGKVNAWPLDEGLIDYVAGDYGTESDENALYTANVIKNTTLKVNGKTVDTSKITKVLLAEKLQEAGGVEANVATGYHAIEFLLWGQDLNGTKKGAGARPATDYDLKNCTGGNCERRRAYLHAVTGLLIDDLSWMTQQWKKGGEARANVLGGTDLDGVTIIVTGMGSLSYGEMAGERMKLGLILHDPEEELDCFSDNTHAAHFNDAKGVQNIYLGSYIRVDGSVVKGASLSDLVKAKDAARDKAMRTALNVTMLAMGAMVKRAEGGEAYDQMIGEGNVSGNKIVQAAIAGLVGQTKELERAIAVLGLKPVGFAGSDSLDNPAKVEP